MKNFKLTCPDGFTKMFSGMTMEEVVDMALLDEEVKKHVTENHPELAGKTPEEIKTMVAGMMTEEVAGAMPGAM